MTNTKWATRGRSQSVVVNKYLDGCVAIRYGPHQVAEFDAGALPIRGATSKRIAAAARIPTSAGCGIRAKNALVQIKMSVLEPVQRVAGAAVIPEHGGKRPYSRCSQHTNLALFAMEALPPNHRDLSLSARTAVGYGSAPQPDNRSPTKADNFRCYQQQCGTEAIRCGSRLRLFGSYGRANPHGLSDTNPDVFRQWHYA